MSFKKNLLYIIAVLSACVFWSTPLLLLSYTTLELAPVWSGLFIGSYIGVFAASVAVMILYINEKRVFKRLLIPSAAVEIAVSAAVYSIIYIAPLFNKA